MRDWWNDPPDQPEIPLCPHCEIELDVLPNGDLVCSECGHRIQYVPDYSEAEIEESQRRIEEVLGPEEVNKLCRHGRMDECPDCDYESDVAFDTERERRLK